jgi:hypothetical protein
MVDNLFARIDGRDYEVEGGNINYAIDEASSFTVKILAKEIDWRNLRFADIEVYGNGALLISGFVDKSPKLEMGNESVLLVSLKCLDELARLTLYRAKSDAHYQDQQVIGIINDLFNSVAASWSISLVNFSDPTITTTLDLRNKETLFAQIAEAAKSVPNVHIRYGGIDSISGDYILEIGNFNDLTSEAIQHHNLVDLKLQYNTNKIYKTVESFGDLTSTTRINLSDALSDPRTILHPDYAQFPISQDAITSVWICTNTAVTVGNDVRKSFNIVKTKNDTVPSATEIAEAGYALWLKTVRFMKKSIDYESYSGEYLSIDVPKIGDRIYLKATILEPIYDPATGNVVSHIETFDVASDYRITKISHKLDRQILADGLAFNYDNSVNVYKFEATSNDEFEEIDPDLELYERLERFDNYDNVSDSLQVYPVQITSLTYGNADAADCNAGGGAPPPSDGKQYLMASPAYPAWVTAVSTTYVIDNGGLVQQLSAPVNPGDSWDGCVQDASSSWPPGVGVNITITVYWLFS